jgi:hypothetical protein
MANRISVTLLALAATLIQCSATRTGDGCTPLSVHATNGGVPGASQRVLEIRYAGAQRHRIAGGGQLPLRGGRVRHIGYYAPQLGLRDVADGGLRLFGSPAPR